MAGGLQDLGEWGIVELFRRSAGATVPDGWVGAGDDCAVLRPGPGTDLLVTTDALVEGVHFLRSSTPPRKLGWKALAASVSDVAAMGGEPLAAFLALGLAPGADQAWLEELRTGLLDCADTYGARLLGGDTVSTPRHHVLCVTVLGQAPAGRRLLRSTARPGDLIYLGGRVGDSAAGLYLLLNPELAFPAESAAPLLRAHQEPRPQAAQGHLGPPARLQGAGERRH